MCDSFCIPRPNGMLFAKSSNRPPDEPQILEWFGRREAGPSLCTTYVSVPDAGSAALLGSRPTWMWGLEHDINEHRLAVANERVWTIGDPRVAPPALVGMDLVRLGLERAATADAALDVITALLAAHHQGGPGEAGKDDPYWSSFSSLSRAAEKPGDEGLAALVEARTALAPIEADAWDEADALWERRADAGRWRTAAAGWSERVRAALAQLAPAVST